MNTQTAIVLLYLLDMQKTYVHILRLQVARQNALLLHIVNTYPTYLTPDDCRAIGDTLTAGKDAIHYTEAA